MSGLKFAVTDWSPSGVNDLIIIRNYNTTEQSEEIISEACFGIDINRYEQITLDDGCSDIDVALVDIETVLSHIAVSPVSDGSETMKALRKAGAL